MFKEKINQEKNQEQMEADSYFERLAQIEQALAREVATLKPLESSISEYAKTRSREFDVANQALLQLFDWLQVNPDFKRLKVGSLKNLRVEIIERSGQETESGLPEFTIPVLIFPDRDWQDKADGSKGVANSLFNQKGIVSAGALFYPPDAFAATPAGEGNNGNPQNPLAVTGLILSKESESDSNIIHESMHFLDFNSELRLDENKILNEIIAFRQAKFVGGESLDRIDWGEFLSLPLILDYYFGNRESKSAKRLNKRVLKVINIINRLDRILNDSSAVTHILLNSLTLEEIEKWGEISDADLEKMKAK